MRLRDRSNDDLGEHFATHCVVGWRKVTEADILPGIGSSDPMEFDHSVYASWVVDRLDIVAGIASAVSDAITARREARGAAAGK